MRFLTPAEQALLDGARPPERTIIRDLYELLDARLVREGAAGESLSDPSASPLDVGTPSQTSPRLVTGATGGSVTPKGMSAGYSARPEPVVPVTEPLFPMHKKEAA